MGYEEDWYDVREMRITAVENGDMDVLRMMALRAGVFAGLAVNQAVWIQEERFAGWLAGKPIVGLPAHQCVERIGAWIAASMTADLFDDLTGAAFAKSAQTIKYLGPAKSHYFAGLMGFDVAPCIDVWMSRVLKEKGVMRQKFPPRGFTQYRKLVEASGWTTLDQWHHFEEVPAQFPGKASFKTSHHRVYFDSVLGRAG
jgi:hypothetical protein